MFPWVSKVFSRPSECMRDMGRLVGLVNGVVNGVVNVWYRDGGHVVVIAMTSGWRCVEGSIVYFHSVFCVS